MTDNSTIQPKISDYTSLLGQNANLVLSMNGLEVQRQFEDSLYEKKSIGTNANDGEICKKYIQTLKLYSKFLDKDEDEGTAYKIGNLTYEVSRNMFYILALLNKYINKVTYITNGEGGYKADTKTLRGVGPYDKYYSNDLFNYIKQYGMSYADSLSFSDGSEDSFSVDIIDVKNNDIPFTCPTDLLDDGKYNELESKGYKNYKKNSLMATALLPSNENFPRFMKTIIHDLYKEYYMNEIEHFQTAAVAINENPDGLLNSPIMVELELLRQHITNEFTNYAFDTKFDAKTDITTELPLSLIIQNVSDVIYNYNTTLEFNMFLNDNTTALKNMNPINFLRHKTNMYTFVGNSIHYDLDIIKRIEEISDYCRKWGTDGFEKKTTRELFRQITEIITMMRNVVINYDIALKVNEDDDYVLHNSIKNDFNKDLNEIEQLLLNYKSTLEGTSTSELQDLNSTQINKFKIIDFIVEFVEKTLNLCDETDKLTALTTNTDVTDKEYNKTLQTFETYFKYFNPSEDKIKNNTFDRYSNICHYRNYTLSLIKTTLCLGSLGLVRTIQCFGYSGVEPEYSYRNITMNPKKYRIYEALIQQPPKINYKLGDLAEIKNLRDKLYKILETKSRVFVGTNPNVEFEKDETIENLIKIFIKFINALNDSDQEDITYDDIVTDDDKHKLYPVTKATTKIYDKLFSTDGSGINSEFKGAKNKLNFEMLINNLNFIAESVVINHDYTSNQNLTYTYTPEDLEKFLNELIELFKAYAVHYSDKNKVTISEIKQDEITINGIYGSNSSVTDIYNVESVEVGIDTNIDNEDDVKYSIAMYTFIKNNLRAIFRSNLPNPTKLVSLITFYVINGYAIMVDSTSTKAVIKKTVITHSK